MSIPANCPKCGAPLAGQNRHGLCPACLLQVGFAGQSATEMPLSDAGLAPTMDHTPSAPTLQPHTLPEPGQHFGGYRIVRTLGKGGMGAVYEADQLETGRRLALKVLKHSLDSPEARKRFLREGRLAASINHPHSVYVYGTEEIEGTPAITMELVTGGTLQEQVKKRGPLPIGEAVDVILQIIAGLEAAQKLGVLHRDIKPANCFVDVDGSVKVGDFGLSISTAPRGESDVTHSGSFLGTPAFASPEQLRGDELNLRSDMYSVGVTLYYLLTGRTPFEADNLVKLLAIVLERKPESPQQFRPEIPRGLSAVVLRCLEKQPTDRYRDYDELRRALLPYASTSPSPATLGLRFFASVLDGMLLFPIFLLLNYLLVSVGIPLLNEEQLSTGDISPRLAVLVFNLLFRIGWFGVWEGLWGRSPGKAICRLRVVGPDRQPPGLGRALARAAILFGLSTPPDWLRYVLDTNGTQLWGVYLSMFSVWGIMLLFFLTARRSNGFASWYDLVTGTRVISREAWQPRVALQTHEQPAEARADAPRVGPYYVLESLGEPGGEEWLLAYDTRLLRRVWIRKLSPGAPPVDVKLRNIGRIGRLRWLTGARGTTENWDAYEAVSGEPLAKLLDRPHAWREVRFWLLDLAEELTAAEKDGSLPGELATDRVWITADGRAKLLDFPAPGVEPSSMFAATPVQFLSNVAAQALEGRSNLAAPSPLGAPAIPLPIRAREVLTSLPQLTSISHALPELQDLTRQLPEVTQARRAILTMACLFPTLLCGLFGVIMFLIQQSWQQSSPDVFPLLMGLVALENMEQGDVPREAEPASGATKEEFIAAFETYLASRYGRVISDPQQWSSPYAAGAISKERRARAERIVAEHPQVSPEELAAATAIVGKFAEGLEKGRKEFNPTQFVWFFALIFVGGYLIWTAVCSLVAALLFRRGLLLWGLGIDLVTASGASASRGRLLWRSIVTWSPLLLLPVALAFILPAIQAVMPDAGITATVATMLIAGAICLGLVIVSMLLPVRGIPDRLAGTWPVPG